METDRFREWERKRGRGGERERKRKTGGVRAATYRLTGRGGNER